MEGDELRVLLGAAAVPAADRDRPAAADDAVGTQVHRR